MKLYFPKTEKYQKWEIDSLTSNRTSFAKGIEKEVSDNVVDVLRQGRQLEAKYRDHELSDKFKGFRECHIKPAGFWSI